MSAIQQYPVFLSTVCIKQLRHNFARKVEFDPWIHAILSNELVNHVFSVFPFPFAFMGKICIRVHASVHSSQSYAFVFTFIKFYTDQSPIFYNYFTFFHNNFEILEKIGNYWPKMWYEEKFDHISQDKWLDIILQGNTNFHNKLMICDWSVWSQYFNQSRSNQHSLLNVNHRSITNHQKDERRS